MENQRVGGLRMRKERNLGTIFGVRFILLLPVDEIIVYGETGMFIEDW